MEQKSKFGSFSWRDTIHSLYMTVVGAVIGDLIAAVQAGTFKLDAITLHTILVSAATAALAYVSKQLASNSQGQLFKTEASVIPTVPLSEVAVLISTTSTTTSTTTTI